MCVCVWPPVCSTLRYTQFDEMRNFPRMTVAQWYLLSLKDYINPLCVSWLWIQCCGTKSCSKTCASKIVAYIAHEAITGFNPFMIKYCSCLAGHNWTHPDVWQIHG